MKCLILGDVHAVWHDMMVTIARAIRLHPDITHIIQVGDFGYGPWPGGNRPFKMSRSFADDEQMDIYNAATKLWLDGNHENHDLLDADQGAWQPDWTYMPRGSVLEVDGFRMMFFGGASSIDKASRQPHISWWPQESITHGQIQKTLNEIDGPIDAIFSHEHPISIPYSDVRYDNRIFGRSDKEALQALKDKYKPDWWFFGHHHHAERGRVNGTEWFCCPIIEDLKYTIWTGTSVETEW